MNKHVHHPILIRPKQFKLIKYNIITFGITVQNQLSPGLSDDDVTKFYWISLILTFNSKASTNPIVHTVHQNGFGWLNITCSCVGIRLHGYEDEATMMAQAVAAVHYE